MRVRCSKGVVTHETDLASIRSTQDLDRAGEQPRHFLLFLPSFLPSFLPCFRFRPPVFPIVRHHAKEGEPKFSRHCPRESNSETWATVLRFLAVLGFPDLQGVWTN